MGIVSKYRAEAAKLSKAARQPAGPERRRPHAVAKATPKAHIPPVRARCTHVSAEAPQATGDDFERAHPLALEEVAMPHAPASEAFASREGELRESQRPHGRQVKLLSRPSQMGRDRGLREAELVGDDLVRLPQRQVR